LIVIPPLAFKAHRFFFVFFFAIIKEQRKHTNKTSHNNSQSSSLKETKAHKNVTFIYFNLKPANLSLSSSPATEKHERWMRRKRGKISKADTNGVIRWSLTKASQENNKTDHCCTVKGFFCFIAFINAMVLIMKGFEKHFRIKSSEIKT